MFRWRSTASQLRASSGGATGRCSSRQIRLPVHLGSPCNPRCKHILEGMRCQRRCRWQQDTAAATCGSPARGSCWLLKEPEELYAVALELSRSRDYLHARSAFEVLLHARPALCKAWVSYAQVSPRAALDAEH